MVSNQEHWSQDSNPQWSQDQATNTWKLILDVDQLLEDDNPKAPAAMPPKIRSVCGAPASPPAAPPTEPPIVEAAMMCASQAVPLVRLVGLRVNGFQVETMDLDPTQKQELDAQVDLDPTQKELDAQDGDQVAQMESDAHDAAAAAAPSLQPAELPRCPNCLRAPARHRCKLCFRTPLCRSCVEEPTFHGCPATAALRGAPAGGYEVAAHVELDAQDGDQVLRADGARRAGWGPGY